MKKKCIDCGCEFEAHDSKQVRCKICQDIYRTEYQRAYWQHNKDKYIDKNITKLGGMPITIKEIRNYNGETIADSEFTKNNEAKWRDDIIQTDKE